MGLRKTAFVSGFSMMPSLKDGDIVFFKIYKEGKSELKPGQIVIFNHPLKNIICIKRISVVNQNNIEVLGDNIEFSEDSNKFGSVKNKKIIGIVSSKLINSKLINLSFQKIKALLWIQNNPIEKDSPPAKQISLLINFWPTFKVVKDIKKVKRFMLINEPIKYEIK